MPFFKKYQFEELDGDKKKQIFSAERLGSRAQSFLEGDDEANQMIKIKNLNLLSTVTEVFDSEENVMDLAILYEVTGFQG